MGAEPRTGTEDPQILPTAEGEPRARSLAHQGSPSGKGSQTSTPAVPGIEPLHPADLEVPEYVLKDSILLLWREVLYLMLEGTIYPSRIAKKLGVTPDLIQRVQDDPEFIRLYDTSKQDMSISAVDRVRSKTHIWMAEMEKLAFCLDPNVRRAALTDLLNRAGTAPSSKLEVGPMAYKKAVDRYIDVTPDEPEK